MGDMLSNKAIVTVDKDYEAFRARLNCLARSINRFSSEVLGETQVRSSFISPFRTTLGYDMINPTEVEVEHVHRKTSVTTNPSFSRIDYIINLNNSPTFIIEAKKSSCTFSDCDLKQLCTYFNEIHPLIGVLTNGIVYKFYTSNEGNVSMRDCLNLTITSNTQGESFSRLDMNKMSKEPFFVFNFFRLFLRISAYFIFTN